MSSRGRLVAPHLTDATPAKRYLKTPIVRRDFPVLRTVTGCMVPLQVPA